MPRRLRIFISSPGDVPDERLRADLVVDKLAQDYGRYYQFDSYRWEHEPMLASGSFQDAIDPPSQFDIVILILWSRLGTALPEKTRVREYRGLDDRVPVTGTEWEFEEALKGMRESGAPDILAFRNVSPAPIDTLDLDAQASRLGQLQALNAFWQRHFADRGVFLAAYDTYRTLEEFAERLERALRALIERRIKNNIGDQQAGGAAIWLGAPFRGLEAYEFEHEPIFFGRDALVAKAAEHLASQARAGSAFLLVSGASGSGKSSLVKAALVPRLMKPQRIEGTVFLRRLVFRPSDGGKNLVQGFIEALLRGPADKGFGLPELLGPGQDAQQLAAHLRASPDAAAFLFSGAVGRVTEAGRRDGKVLAFEQAKLILVIDQLEELFTIASISAEECRTFVRLLYALACSGAVWIVATMRADFWHRAAEFPDLVTLCEGLGRIDVAAPSAAEIAEMIRKPAEAAGLSFEADPRSGLRLDAVLAEHATAAAGVLPLLSFTLDALYAQDVKADGGQTLKHATYETLGGLYGAIATRADHTLAVLPQAAQDSLPRVLRTLATVSTGTDKAATARTVPLHSFPEGSDARVLVDALIAARLLIASSDGSEPTVRFAHEALINRWEKASDLLASSRRDLETRAMIEQQQARWSLADPANRHLLLLRDFDLASALDLVKRSGSELTPSLRDYVAQSDAAAKAATRRRQAIVAAVFVVLLAFAAASFGSLLLAKKQRDAALIAESDFLARNSRTAAADGNTTLATILALAGLPRRIGNPDRPFVAAAEYALEEALANRRERFVLQGHHGTVWSVAFSPDGKHAVTADDDHSALIWNVATGAMERALNGHTDRVWHAAFSPDGTRIVTASNDNTARLWDAATGAPLAVLSGHRDAVTFAAFSSDNALILTASDDNTARLWDARTGSSVTVFTGHEGLVMFAALSPDGKRVVTASTDKTARIWDAATGRELVVLRGHDDFVTTAPFSPDGERVLTTSWDKTARIWDARSGALLKVLKGHEQMILAAAFSPDGALVATASADRTARLWNAETGTAAWILKGHEDWVNSVDFSHDGTRVLTASNDTTTRLWDTNTGAAVAVLRGDDGFIDSAVFSPDDRLIATASYDRTARLWESETDAMVRVFRKHKDWVYAAALSPDGKLLGTASEDHTARIWDAQTATVRAILDKHRARVTSIAFSPDGKRVVTTSDDGTAQVWDVATATTIQTFKGHKSWVESAAFSPDGRRVVTGSNDRTAQVWDAQTGETLAVMNGHKNMVTATVFSPDGKRVLTASWDGTAKLWDAGTGKLQIELAGHKGRVTSAAFSSDGARVVTGADDETARVWDSRTGVQLAVMHGHDGNVTSVAFSPDGKRILTGSWDKTARIWEWEVGKTIIALRGHIGHVTSVGFSGDGSTVVTASKDWTARLWHLPVHCQALIDQAEREEPAPPTPVERGRYFLSDRTEATGTLNFLSQMLSPMLPNASESCE